MVGYQDQGNLGMGYLAAVLQRHGCAVELIDVRDGGEKIGARLAAHQPLVVGFSLIFQFFLPQFREVAQQLRAAGVTSHFTIGGHYPSLCHDELLTNFPEIDSVVRFEGEETLIALVDRLNAGQEWRDVEGIAYLSGPDVVTTQARPLVQDLELAAVPLPPLRARAHRRLPDAAAAGEPRLHPALLVLLDSHVLPHGARQGSARAPP